MYVCLVIDVQSPVLYCIVFPPWLCVPSFPCTCTVMSNGPWSRAYSKPLRVKLVELPPVTNKYENETVGPTNEIFYYSCTHLLLLSLSFGGRSHTFALKTSETTVIFIRRAILIRPSRLNPIQLFSVKLNTQTLYSRLVR